MFQSQIRNRGPLLGVGYFSGKSGSQKDCHLKNLNAYFPGTQCFWPGNIFTKDLS